jgi:hypothetical protein
MEFLVVTGGVIVETRVRMITSVARKRRRRPRMMPRELPLLDPTLLLQLSACLPTKLRRSISSSFPEPTPSQ